MAATTLTLTIHAYATSMLADLALLERAADLSLQVRQRLLDLFGGGLELLRIHVESGGAVPAGELRTRLELADSLAQLAAAVRAGDVDGLVVQD